MRYSVDSALAKRIREQGRCERSGMITVWYLTDISYRFSPVVSKKQGSAPERNRVKRIIRELMRAGEGAFPNGSYLIVCYGACGSLTREELSGALHAIMEKNGAGAHSDPRGTEEHQ